MKDYYENAESNKKVECLNKFKTIIKNKEGYQKIKVEEFEFIYKQILEPEVKNINTMINEVDNLMEKEPKNYGLQLDYLT